MATVKHSPVGSRQNLRGGQGGLKQNAVCKRHNWSSRQPPLSRSHENSQNACKPKLVPPLKTMHAAPVGHSTVSQGLTHSTFGTQGALSHCPSIRLHSSSWSHPPLLMLQEGSQYASPVGSWTLHTDPVRQSVEAQGLVMSLTAGHEAMSSTDMEGLCFKVQSLDCVGSSEW